ncbi:MAG TPA: hypothetical protein VN226_05930 [Anaerolineales bacterium]|nr:hypothetical protein [Anaerolineales bacterium]
MRSFIILPILAIGIILQSAVLGRFSLLAGKADLLLLILISWNLNKDDKAFYLWAIFAGALYALYSATQIFMPFILYVFVSAITRKIKSMTYHLPIFLLILSTLVGSVVFYGLTMAQAWIFSGFQVNLSEMFWQIMIPSMFLNLVLILPVNSIVKEFARFAQIDIETK